MSNNFKRCTFSCDAFKCAQRALSYSGQRAYCRWADDECAGPTCNYAICTRGKMLTNGICGLSIHRKTEEDRTPEPPANIGIKLRGKLLRRFKEDEIF